MKKIYIAIAASLIFISLGFLDPIAKKTNGDDISHLSNIYRPISVEAIRKDYANRLPQLSLILK